MPYLPFDPFAGTRMQTDAQKDHSPSDNLEKVRALSNSAIRHVKLIFVTSTEFLYWLFRSIYLSLKYMTGQVGAPASKYLHVA